MRSLIFLSAAFIAAAPMAYAKDYTVKMVTNPEAKQPYRFSPARLAIQPGDIVHFVDAQDDMHDVMFEAAPKGVGMVMSPMLEKQGQSWSYTFKTPGTYKYHCHPHEALGMRGEIIVGQASAPMEMEHMEHHHHEDTKGMDMEDMPGMDGPMTMNGFLGTYDMNREGSGTSWMPDSAPMDGLHFMAGDWMGMLHGYVNLVYDHQGGPRGDDKAFTEGMIMAMASRPLWDGTWGVRAMVSPDPLMGKSGYPLLLQTGETADGRTPLIDRQHPHDLFMELATTYSHPVGGGSMFTYIGYPGEPALGPSTFMHRASGIDNPEAPISHHWLDSTHITFGVATIGYIWQDWKIEGSVFNGREPDQLRWNFDRLRLNSYAGRISYNPTKDWSFQISQGYIKSPEALEPDVNQNLTTASGTYNNTWDDGNWQTTLAWGMNNNSPGHTSNAVLLESAVSWHDRHTVFGRAEWVQKDELFDSPAPQAGTQYNVGKASAGYIYDIPIATHLKLGIGGLGSVYALPSGLDQAYGRDPASAMAFVRLKIK